MPSDAEIDTLRDAFRKLSGEAADARLCEAALRLAESSDLLRAWREIDRRAQPGWGTRFPRSFHLAWIAAHAARRTHGQARTAAKRCAAAARRTATLVKREGVDWNASAFMDHDVPSPLVVVESLLRPTISDVLLAYAETLDNFVNSAEFMLGVDRHMPQPDAPTAVEVALIRAVAEAIDRECDSALYRTTGAIVGIALGVSAFDQEYVKGVLRRQRRP